MWSWLKGLGGKDSPPSLLDELLKEALPGKRSNRYSFQGPELPDYPAGRKILALEPGEQAALVVEMFRRYAVVVMVPVVEHHQQNLLWALVRIASQLMRRRLPYREEQLVALAELLGHLYLHRAWDLPVAGFVRAVEIHAQESGLGPSLRQALKPLPDHLEALLTADRRRILERIRQLLRQDDSGEPGFKLPGGDAWADALREELDALPPEESGTWREILVHCATTGSTRPSAKWLGRARDLLGRLSPGEASRVIALCLGRLGRPGTRTRSAVTGAVVDPVLLDESQIDLLRGLVWCAGLVGEPGMVSTLSALSSAAEACFRKVSGHGPLSVRIGNACIDTLSRLDTPAAVAQLSRLSIRVKHPASKRQIDAALAKAAERQGLTPAELEERIVPTFGLEEVGVRRETLGDATAELRVTGTASTELVWLRPDGRPQKSVPKAIKEGHSEELRSLTATAKEIQKLLPAQRDRLERLYLLPRQWDLATWRERYLDHPLVGTLARRLVWRFDGAGESRTGCWRGGEIVDAEGHPLTGLDATRVALWHPLDSNSGQVLAWRRALEGWEVVQPFKQAHREIYLLTDAERRTRTYSNRFAAHILKQHQFAALCRQRGWTYTLQGQWDSHNVPTRLLPELDLQVEFWVESLADQTHFTEAGIYLYITTDQVRFCDSAGGPRPLEQVPPLLFSELMRDVDLFVGVCSVGNDPTWTDQGQRTGFDYWRDFAFGQLSESAQTRRELLERLLPRLKIADRCSLTDRFLVVRGDLRLYKIHLGSANIVMEPNGQYLCIVRDASRSRDGHPILPFEGDGTLAVILSKAFLLAEDRKITDPTIVRQIRAG